MVFSDVSEWTAEIAAIDAELNRVMDKFGDQSLNLFDWQSILAEEAGEVAKAVNEHEFFGGDLQNVYTEAIHAAAVAVHMAAVIREANEA
jgi:NTP pyrophosphatase (non-canonical NTP hydrolase)